MSKKQMDSLQEISDSNVQEILFDKKPSSKKSRKSDKLTTSSAQESGSDSLGEARMVIPTPPDATALVRVNDEGKLHFDTKAIAQENRELKDEVLALRSRLEELSRSPRSHPDPSPARDPLTEGLERVLCQSQFDSLCKFVAEQVHSAVKSGKEVISIPSLPSEAPSSSRMASPQEGSFGKNLEKPSPRDILGSSIGDGSEDDLEDISLDDKAG